MIAVLRDFVSFLQSLSLYRNLAWKPTALAVGGKAVKLTYSYFLATLCSVKKDRDLDYMEEERLVSHPLVTE